MSLMKKIVLAAIATSAMAFAACSDEPIVFIEKPAEETVTINFIAGDKVAADADTKTYIAGENNNAYWSQTGEKLEIFETVVTVNSTTGAEEATTTNKESSEGVVSDDHRTAVFSVDLSVEKEGSSYVYNAIYPASAYVTSNNKDVTKLKVTTPAIQSPALTSFDPAADLLVAKPVNGQPEKGANFYLEFARIVAVGKIAISGLPTEDPVRSVEFIAPEGVKLNGRTSVNLSESKVVQYGYDGESNSVTMNYAAETNFTNDNVAIFTCLPCELPAGSKFKVVVSTATKIYTRECTVPEGSPICYYAGSSTYFSINMATATVEDVKDYSGNWLITGTKDSQLYAAKKWVYGNDNLKTLAISLNGEGKIPAIFGIEDCKMKITKVTEGEYEGMYTIEDAGSTADAPRYLYAASSSNNHMKATNTLNADTYWTIKEEAGIFSIVASKSTNRNVMQFNSTLFSCYKSASQSPVALYDYDETVVAVPLLAADETAIDVSAADVSAEFTFKSMNLTGNVTANVKSGATMTNVAATVAENKVTVTFDANSEAVEKTATIVLSSEGAESVEVTITQEAYVEPGSVATYVKVTSAPADGNWEGTYLIVYEDGSVAYDGSLTSTFQGSTSIPNKVSVSIKNGVIVSNSEVDNITVTIAQVTGGYSIKTKAGFYIGQSKTDNGIYGATTWSDDYLNQISYNNGVVEIVPKGTCWLTYNKSAGYFRYYKQTTVNSSTTGYIKPQLYKYTAN